MKKITVEENIIYLNYLKEQVFNNRPFRLSGTRKNLQHPQKWIDLEKMYMHHYFHTFKYIDEKGGFFEIEIDYNDIFVKLTKC